MRSSSRAQGPRRGGVNIGLAMSDWILAALINRHARCGRGRVPRLRREPRASLCLRLRHLGTARAGAYFSVAPFFGATLALARSRRAAHLAARRRGRCMAIGVWLHVTERHGSRPRSRSGPHTHAHSHDEHHRHEHDVRLGWRRAARSFTRARAADSRTHALSGRSSPASALKQQHRGGIDDHASKCTCRTRDRQCLADHRDAPAWSQRAGFRHDKSRQCRDGVEPQRRARNEG